MNDMTLTDLIEFFDNMKADGFRLNYSKEDDTIVLYANYQVLTITENENHNHIFDVAFVNSRNHVIREVLWDSSEIIDFIAGY